MIMVARILCIGESDSCAGTGIQADIKTAQAFGGYAATALTAVSVQNTHGIFDMHHIPAEIVRHQIEKVFEDLKPSVVKTGMLGNAAIIDVIGDVLDDLEGSGVQVVIDPVMTNRTGRHVLDKEGRDALKRRLLIRADILTPNIEEAQELSGIKINDIDDMTHAAETLRSLGAQIVILQGGSLSGERIHDVLADDNGTEIYTHERYESRSTHGAGATLSAGIAVGLSQGLNTREAFVRARAFVNKAIAGAHVMGGGVGPLNHCVVPEDMRSEDAA